MYLKTPKMFGRPMKLVKKYPRFALYVDEKTGIKQSFQYWDLTHEIKLVDDRETVFKYNDKGELVLVDAKKALYTPPKPVKKTKVMSDKRVDDLIKSMFSDLV